MAVTTIRTTDASTWRRLTVLVLRQLVRSLEADGIETIRTVDLAHAVDQLERKKPKGE